MVVRATVSSPSGVCLLVSLFAPSSSFVLLALLLVCRARGFVLSSSCLSSIELACFLCLVVRFVPSLVALSPFGSLCLLSSGSGSPLLAARLVMTSK